MQAKQLHEVLARVVAWHNRHPLALRISPTQVHSIGGVALPFASDVRPEQPPTLTEVLDAPADPDAAFASLLADADAAMVAEAPAEAGGDDAAATPAEPVSAAQPLPEIEPAPEPAPPADAPTETLVEPRPEAPAAADDDAAGTAPAIDDAPLELAMALDEVAAQADAEAAAALAQAAGDAPRDTAADPAEPSAAAAPAEPPSVDPTEPPTEPSADALAGGTTVASEPLPADPAPADGTADESPSGDGSLAERLQAARERAMATGSVGADAAIDIPLDAPSHAPVAHAAPLAGGVAAAAPSRHWLARLWAGLPLGFARRRAAGHAAAAGGAAPAGRLAPLFSKDFMWPRTPREVARWVQRHGAGQPLAPAGWPQRQVETDATLLQAARRKGLPHPVTRHVLTAAIGVGDRRIRLLIDADGHILGPRAFDRRRIGLLGSGSAAVAAVALVAVLGPWRQRTAPDEAVAHADAAASAALAASAASAAAAASAAVAAVPGAAASDAHGATAATAAAPPAGASAAHAAAEGAHDTPAGVQAAATAAHGAHATPPSAPVPAHAGRHGSAADPHGTPEAAAHADAPAEPAATAVASAASAPVSVVKVTHEPPPRWPVTRASGPLVAIRLRLSDEAKQAARAEVAAARAAARGEAPPATLPATPPGTAAAPVSLPGLAPAAPRPGPQEAAVRVAQQPGTVYAVVTPVMAQRESAEAILAQMMSVRARLAPSAPDHGEVMSHQGRWRAAWWPFASAADAERARAMLVARGMRAEVIEF